RVTAQGFDLGHGAIDGTHDLARKRRRLHMTSRAVEQQLPEVGLELLHLQADGAARQIDLLRGSGEITVRDHGGKRGQVLQFHRLWLRAAVPAESRREGSSRAGSAIVKKYSLMERRIIAHNLSLPL